MYSSSKFGVLPMNRRQKGALHYLKQTQKNIFLTNNKNKNQTNIPSLGFTNNTKGILSSDPSSPTNTPIQQKGLILVFDLDETIVSHKDLSLNEKIIDILKVANQKKVTGEVEAILMLTNNADQQFIDIIHKKLKESIGVNTDIFDNIHDRTTKTRKYNPTPNATTRALMGIANNTKQYYGYIKYWNDILLMLNEIGYRYTEKDKENILNRTYFFDDMDNHILVQELPEKHFIHITPPFISNKNDTTDYSSIYEVLGMNVKGGRRYIKNKTCKSKKQSKRRTYRKNK